MDNILGSRKRTQPNGLDPFWLWVTPHVLVIVLMARLGWALLMNMGFGPPRHQVVLRAAPDPLTVRAVVKSFRSKTVAAPFTGTVEHLAVRRGERVHRGEVLFTMDVDEDRRRERIARQNAAAAAEEVRKGRQQRAAALRRLNTERRAVQAKLRHLKRLQARHVAAPLVPAPAAPAPMPATGVTPAQGITPPFGAGVESANVAEVIRRQEITAQRAEYENRFTVNALARKNLVSQFHRAIAAALQRQQSAEAELHRLRPLLAQARQASPIDGTVTEVHTLDGGWVNTGQPLVRVDNPAGYRLITLIRKDPKGRIVPGLTVPARMGNRDVRATVVRLEPGRGRTLFYTWIYLKPAHPELVTHGLLAQVTLPRGTLAAPMQVAGTGSSSSISTAR